MSQQTDRFFRGKLHGYQKPMSPGAWERVARLIDRKNTFPQWMKIAASLLLMATVGLFVISPDDTPTEEMAMNTVGSNNNGTPEETLTPSDPQAQISSPENSVTPRTRRDGDAQTARPLPGRKPHGPATKAPGVNPLPATRETVAVISEDTPGALESPALAAEVKLTQEHADPQDTETKSVTLVYTAAEVNEKYLDKRYAVHATPEADKSSGLKKLLDKAHDLKNNQDPLGDLRQKKNEILAFNFRGDKQRKN